MGLNLSESESSEEKISPNAGTDEINIGPSHEKLLSPHNWNKLLVLLINMFEITIITLSLSLTVYQDDASSVLFLFLMQLTLYYSMRNRGNEVGKQKKITIYIVILLFFMGILKTVVYFMLNKAISKEDFE